MNLSKDNMKKIYGLVTFTVLLYLCVRNLNVVIDAVETVFGFLFPFILGCGIAFILNVPMKFIERHLFGKARQQEKKWAKKLSRPLSLILSICFLVLLLVIVIEVVVPELGATIVNVIGRIENNIPVFQKWLENTFSNNPQILKWAGSLETNPKEIVDSVLSVLKNGVNNFVTSTVSLTMGILSTAMNVGVGFVFACYVLLQKEKLISQVKKVFYALLPEKPVKYIAHVWHLVNKTFSSFIAGQCIEAVILGSMFFVSMTIFRFPYAMLVGVLIAFTALIPVFGGIIGCWVGFFLILMVSPVKAFMFLVLFVVLQQIEGNMIYPHVVGNSVGLPSIWVLVAVTLGGSLMGIVGMLIFIPLVSVIYTLFREWIYKRIEQKQISV
ncbi:MAG: AI-2E family transporter [Clostridia bacterium]|nr:AI-2E family transporter [Clostridia bacterium]MDY5554995.1 AI-2E family transporter [Blautia sp.]